MRAEEIAGCMVLSIAGVVAVLFVAAVVLIVWWLL